MKNRPEILQFITKRKFYSFDATQVKKVPFDDAAYTSMVLEKIAESNDLNYHENGWTLLHSAVNGQEYDFVSALIEQGLDVNARTDKGVTPLHLALSVYGGEEDDPLIEILLAHGADRNIDFDGMSAKEFAEFSGAGKFFV